MVTYAEFFLFVALIASLAHGFYWRGEAKKWFFLFKLMLTDERSRKEILENYQEFKRKVG